MDVVGFHIQMGRGDDVGVCREPGVKLLKGWSFLGLAAGRGRGLPG